MVAVAPPSRARKAVHDGGFIVVLGGLILAFLSVDSPNPSTVILGASLVAVGAAMVWLGSRRPPRTVSATVPPAA